MAIGEIGGYFVCALPCNVSTLPTSRKKDQTCPDSLHVSVAEVLRCCGLRVSPRWRQRIDAILDACRALKLSWSFVSSRHGWGGGERGRGAKKMQRGGLLQSCYDDMSSKWGHGKTPTRTSTFTHTSLHHLVVALPPDPLTRPKITHCIRLHSSQPSRLPQDRHVSSFMTFGASF